MTTKTNIKHSRKELLIKYFIIIVSLSFVFYAVYEFINWNKIFEDNFKNKEIKQREINLPVRVGEAELSYVDQLALEDIANSIKKTGENISHYEVMPFSQLKVSLESGYYLLIKLTKDNVILNNNIYSILTDPKFLEVKDSKEIEYLDFRLLDKVFFKVKSNNEMVGLESNVNTSSSTPSSNTHNSTTTQN